MSVELKIPAKVDSVADIAKIREELARAEKILTTPKPGMKVGDVFISVRPGAPIPGSYFIGVVNEVRLPLAECRVSFRFTYIGGPGYEPYIGKQHNWTDGWNDYTVVKGVVGWAPKS